MIKIYTEYWINQIDSLFDMSIKSVLISLFIFVTKLYHFAAPWFFGEKFIIILTILLIVDLFLGIKKHINLGDFNWGTMAYKFIFKLSMVALASVSVKALLSINELLDSDIMRLPVQLTIALFLFGNIEKNICQLTNKTLCFEWLIDKIKDTLSIFKRK